MPNNVKIYFIQQKTKYNDKEDKRYADVAF